MYDTYSHGLRSCWHRVDWPTRWPVHTWCRSCHQLQQKYSKGKFEIIVNWGKTRILYTNVRTPRQSTTVIRVFTCCWFGRVRSRWMFRLCWCWQPSYLGWTRWTPCTPLQRIERRSGVFKLNSAQWIGNFYRLEYSWKKPYIEIIDSVSRWEHYTKMVLVWMKNYTIQDVMNLRWWYF